MFLKCSQLYLNNSRVSAAQYFCQHINNKEPELENVSTNWPKIIPPMRWFLAMIRPKVLEGVTLANQYVNRPSCATPCQSYFFFAALCQHSKDAQLCSPFSPIDFSIPLGISVTPLLMIESTYIWRWKSIMTFMFECIDHSRMNNYWSVIICSPNRILVSILQIILNLILNWICKNKNKLELLFFSILWI